MSTLRIVLIVAVLVSAFYSPADAAMAYTFTDLGRGQANGINNSGAVVGENVSAFLYANGTMTNLASSGWDSWPSYAYGINDSGLVVGMTPDVNGNSHAWSGRSMNYIGDLGGQNSGAKAVNNAGQIVGWANIKAGPGVIGMDGPSHAFIYQNGTLTDLNSLINPASGWTLQRANSINKNGQIVGVGTNASGQTHGFLYYGGAVTDLGGGNSSCAYGINNSGVAVGWNSSVGAFLYDNGVMTDLGAGNNSAAYSINSAGQVVGALGSGHAFLYSGGIVTDLNSLINPTSIWTLQYAYGINDNGQIVGQAVNSTGQVDAFLLTPVPEPATMGLLAVGLATLLARRKTRP